MRRYLLISIGFGLLVFLSGCSGSKVGLLKEQVSQAEEQLAQIQEEKSTLEQENARLRMDLESTKLICEDLRNQLEAKDQMLEEQDESLSELRLQNLELKTSMEDLPAEKPTKKTVQQPASVPEKETSGMPAKKPSKPTQVTQSSDYQADYDRAIGMFKNKQYMDAAGLFSELIQSNKNNPLADNCQYWIGECYYAEKQYENALAEFEKVFVYPNSNKVDAAQLKIGLCWLKLGKNAEAKEQLIRLMSAYPNSEYVARARTILESIP